MSLAARRDGWRLPRNIIDTVEVDSPARMAIVLRLMKYPENRTDLGLGRCSRHPLGVGIDLLATPGGYYILYCMSSLELGVGVRGGMTPTLSRTEGVRANRTGYVLGVLRGIRELDP